MMISKLAIIMKSALRAIFVLMASAFLSVPESFAQWAPNAEKVSASQMMKFVQMTTLMSIVASVLAPMSKLALQSSISEPQIQISVVLQQQEKGLTSPANVKPVRIKELCITLMLLATRLLSFVEKMNLALVNNTVEVNNAIETLNVLTIGNIASMDNAETDAT